MSAWQAGMRSKARKASNRSKASAYSMRLITPLRDTREISRYQDAKTSRHDDISSFKHVRVGGRHVRCSTCNLQPARSRHSHGVGPKPESGKLPPREHVSTHKLAPARTRSRTTRGIPFWFKNNKTPKKSLLHRRIPFRTALNPSRQIFGKAPELFWTTDGSKPIIEYTGWAPALLVPTRRM